MKLFRTARGIARQQDDELLFLELGGRNLDTVLADGDFASLARAEVRGRESLANAMVEGNWLPLLESPSRFVIAGMNYRAHCEEIGVPVPDKLIYGFAPGTATNASGLPIIMPAEANSMIDYEGEIGVVIGRQASNIDAADGWSYVAALTPLNDVSARDVQAARTREAVGLAKGFPTFKPFGPCLATPDEFDNPDDIEIHTWVNGDQRQHGRTADMAFPISEIIAVVSAEVTLMPGDVICTGTPGGVAHGGKHPYLAAGDLVEIKIGDLPTLANHLAPAS